MLIQIGLSAGYNYCFLLKVVTIKKPTYFIGRYLVGVFCFDKQKSQLL